MMRAAQIETVRPVMPTSTVSFRGVAMVLAHGRGKAALEWMGVALFTLFLVAVFAWILANPSGGAA